MTLRKFLEKDNKDGAQRNNCFISSSFCVAETAFRARVAFLIFCLSLFCGKQLKGSLLVKDIFIERQVSMFILVQLQYLRKSARNGNTFELKTLSKSDNLGRAFLKTSWNSFRFQNFGSPSRRSVRRTLLFGCVFWGGRRKWPWFASDGFVAGGVLWGAGKSLEYRRKFKQILP